MLVRCCRAERRPLARRRQASNISNPPADLKIQLPELLVRVEVLDKKTLAILTKLCYNKAKKGGGTVARYKVITSKDHQYELRKKRKRIHHIVDAVYVLLMLIGIVICGLNQFNDLITGVGLILMGIISIPIAIFYVYMYKNKWRPPLWYDDPKYRQYVDKKTKEKDFSEIRFKIIFLTVFLFLFSVGLPIAGILRLLGII